MELTYSDDQRLLKESAERWIADEYGFEQRAEILNSDHGMSRAAWKSFGDLGWLMLPIPEAAGGLGGSAVDVGILMEAFGKGLVLEPFLTSAVIAAGIVAEAGSEAQRDAILPGCLSGDTILAFAHSERHSRIDPFTIKARATRTDGGWSLDGEKIAVAAAPVADHIIVSALIGEGPDMGLFLVSPQSAGLTSVPVILLDGQRASDLSLANVRLGDDALLGGSTDARATIEAAFDRAIVASSAAAVGSMDTLLAKTADYLKTRVQFGEPLATKQALRHRVADMAVRFEQARASALRAALVIDGGATGHERTAAILAAKAMVGRAARFVGEQAVQLHGGMGVTEELDIGSYFRSLIAFERMYGSTDYSRRRYAALQSHAAA